MSALSDVANRGLGSAWPRSLAALSASVAKRDRAGKAYIRIYDSGQVRGYAGTRHHARELPDSDLLTHGVSCLCSHPSF